MSALVMLCIATSCTSFREAPPWPTDVQCANLPRERHKPDPALATRANMQAAVKLVLRAAHSCGFPIAGVGAELDGDTWLVALCFEQPIADEPPQLWRVHNDGATYPGSCPSRSASHAGASLAQLLHITELSVSQTDPLSESFRVARGRDGWILDTFCADLCVGGMTRSQFTADSMQFVYGWASQ